jgi:hypothetical protein
VGSLLWIDFLKKNQSISFYPFSCLLTAPQLAALCLRSFKGAGAHSRKWLPKACVNRFAVFMSLRLVILGGGIEPPPKIGFE